MTTRAVVPSSLSWTVHRRIKSLFGGGGWSRWRSSGGFCGTSKTVCAEIAAEEGRKDMETIRSEFAINEYDNGDE